MMLRRLASRSPLTLSLLAATAVLWVVFSHYFAPQRGDDSFIFYRIADNVLAGHGPVFNPGERVEAYSSPSWLAVLVSARALGFEYVGVSRWLGVLLSGATLLAAYRLAEELDARRPLPAATMFATALGGTLWYWAPSGLETVLYTATFAWVCIGIARGGGTVWAIATALLGVTRPEGVFLAPLSLAFAWLAGGARPRGAHVAVALGVPAAYLAFRLAYFGVPFPNTYYAKATGALDRRLVMGLDYAFWVVVPLAALVLVPAFIRVRATIADAAKRRRVAVALFAGALLGAVILGGGDWMWGRRLVLPAIVPTLAVLASWATELRARHAAAAFAAAALLVVQEDLPWPDRKDYEPLFFGREAASGFREDPARALTLRFVRPLRTTRDALLWRTMPEGSRVEGTMTVVSEDVAKYVRSRWPDDTLVAVNHAGAVPYFTQMPTVDMTGLADAHIARFTRGGLHEKYDVDYVLSRKPGLFVLNSRVEPNETTWYTPGYWDGESALVADPRFAREYRAVPVYWPWQYSDGFTSFILLYERIPAS
jgi:hypothetical protein